MAARDDWNLALDDDEEQVEQNVSRILTFCLNTCLTLIANKALRIKKGDNFDMYRCLRVYA